MVMVPVFNDSSLKPGLSSFCNNMGLLLLFFSWLVACVARCRNCAVYMVIPFTVTVLGMVLVDSILFCSVTAEFTICSGVKVTGGVYNMGMFEEVQGLTVINDGKLPVLL